VQNIARLFCTTLRRSSVTMLALLAHRSSIRAKILRDPLHGTPETPH
jgi:hypothetical protein